MNTVIYPRLEFCGRLGNQLWQIAGTLGLARALGGDPVFPDQWSYRRYFSVPDQYFAPIVDPRWGGTDSSEAVAPMLPDIRARAYLQALALWDPHAEEVRAWFQPSDEALEILKETELHGQLGESISLHVRRGDNVYQPEHFWLPTVEYYQTALAALPTAPIAVFSDDPHWCQHVLRPALAPRELTIYHGQTRPREDEPNYWSSRVTNRDWVDLFLQAQCKYHIISNSTYSWWGAWLSRQPWVLYPSQWYGPAITWMEPERMFPRRGWYCIPVEPRRG